MSGAGRSSSPRTTCSPCRSRPTAQVMSSRRTRPATPSGPRCCQAARPSGVRPSSHPAPTTPPSCEFGLTGGRGPGFRRSLASAQSGTAAQRRADSQRDAHRPAAPARRLGAASLDLVPATNDEPARYAIGSSYTIALDPFGNATADMAVPAPRLAHRRAGQRQPARAGCQSRCPRRLTSGLRPRRSIYRHGRSGQIRGRASPSQRTARRRSPSSRGSATTSTSS